MDPNDVKPRTQQAVPSPDSGRQLSEEEQRALELNAEAEHEQGHRKEEVVQKADDLAGSGS